MRQIAIDVIGLGGLGSFLYGVWLVHPPASLIAGGLVAFGFSALASKRRAP